VVDDGNPGGGAACSAGIGECSADGTIQCSGGALSCDAVAGSPSDEVCDGLDNNCDAGIDEDLGTLSCGVGECAVTVEACFEANNQVCTPLAPVDEVCDALDNDCDGDTDEELGVTTCGVGACAVTVEACVGGTTQVCNPGTPTVEVCDLVDNDCDGQIDEGGVCVPTNFLVIDEDSIDNGVAPNFFSDVDVNDDMADIGLRTQLPFFAANPGLTITLHTGEVGDEGWFALMTIPESWDDAGPNDGLRNYLNAEAGLGTESDDLGPEDLLDKIPDVTPLRFTGLQLLEGERVCAVVYDSDISINYDPINGSLKGDNLGVVAFEVLSVVKLDGFSSSSLPEVGITLLDATNNDGTGVCQGPLQLFLDAPEPTSSSEPEDVGPDP